MEELRPCPFCGGNPRHQVSKPINCQLHGEPIQHHILKCCVVTVVEVNKEQAAAKWNTRQSASGEIEALEEAACDVENMAINEYGVNPTLLKHVRRVEYAKKQAATLRHMAARMK